MGGMEEIEMRDRGCKKHEKSLRGVARNPEEGNPIKVSLKQIKGNFCCPLTDMNSFPAAG